jgi:nicotinate-nucleotide adenylyltransferase
MFPMLCFGGSFNPVHRAHLTCSAAAARAAGVGRVRLILAARPPLKKADYLLAPLDDRLAMLRLAITDAAALPETADIEFALDDSELRRTGLSYTIDTVEELAVGGEPVHWLIGADQLLSLHRWHRFDELIHLARFWVMARPGYVIDWAALPPAVAALRQNVVIVPQMDVSATEVRTRLREGKAIDDLVTDSVDRYIREHGLYR